MNVNKVIISGRLTGDPILKQLNSGSSVLTFNLETKQEFKNASGTKATFNFIDCVVWGNSAESYAQSLKKDFHILIEGSLALDSFTTQSGDKRNKHKVNVQSIVFLNSGNKIKPEVKEHKFMNEMFAD